MQEPPRHTTRFIGLAEVGNLEKKKWVYAFNIVPMTSMAATELSAQPENATECPFKAKDVEMPVEKAQINTFFYSDKPPEDDNKDRKRRGENGHRDGGAKKPFVPSGPCWFCKSMWDVGYHVGDQLWLLLVSSRLLLSFEISRKLSIICRPFVC